MARPSGVGAVRQACAMPAVRRATLEDADAIARLLQAFNVEYDEPSPGPERIAERLRVLLGEDTTVLLTGDGPDGPTGLAVLRLRPSLWSAGLECYLAELYVVPERRGQGLGRALMDETIAVARHAGADHLELNTSEDDVAARALYESLGFTNRERGGHGPITYYYEREL
jgi:ribosomal protein S18 acetylase RimI-like enzyme